MQLHLPNPSEAEQNHSQALLEVLRSEIEAQSDGVISFERYMQQCLYHNEYGYYEASEIFGQAGDFTTASELSELFSKCIAQQYTRLREQQATCDILEIGAGSGTMATQILKHLDAANMLPNRYVIAETSEHLRTRQYKTLKRNLPNFIDRVQWITEEDEHSSASFSGLIVGNEVLYALPVELFRYQAGEYHQRCVAVREDQLTFIDRPASGELAQSLEALNIDWSSLPSETSYQSEHCRKLPAFISRYAELLNQGVMLFIDYGYPRSEYYHPQRSKGTLQCHYRHLANPDPLWYPGLQDISANVDFTAVAEAAVANNLDVLAYTTQAHFLMASGILENEQLLDTKTSTEIKQLLLPGEMGERFQVMALGKRVDLPANQFGARDLRHRL